MPAGRQGSAHAKAREVDEVVEHGDPVGHAALDDQTVAGGPVDGDVAGHGRQPRRQLLPGDRAVAEADHGGAGEAQGGDRRLQVVVPVDHVGRLAEAVEVVDDGHVAAAQLTRDVPEPRAERHRGVPRASSPKATSRTYSSVPARWSRVLLVIRTRKPPIRHPSPATRRPAAARRAPASAHAGLHPSRFPLPGHFGYRVRP